MNGQIFESMADRLQKDVLCHIAYTYSAFIPKDTESIRSKMKSTIYKSDRIFLDSALRATIGNQVVFPYDVLTEKINIYINDFYAELALSGETLEKLSKYGERADIFKNQFNDNLEKSKANTLDAVEKDLHTFIMLDMDAKAVMKNMKKLLSLRTDAVKRLLTQSNGQMEKYMLLWEYQDMGYTRYRLRTNGDTCEDCTSLNGKIFSADKAKSGENFPPMHPNCDCTFEIIDEQGNVVITADERAVKEKDDKLAYLSTSLKQLVLGNYTDDVTLLGTVLQLVSGFTGIDVVGDMRDLFHDVTNWENTPEHILQTALDSIALVPVVGGIKYADEAADLIQTAAKHGDEAADAVKVVRKQRNETADAVDRFIKNNVNPHFQQNVKEAFANDAKVTVLEKDMTVYRYHGGSSSPNSYWYTPNQTSNPASDLALPQGNTYQHMDTYTVPKGTTVLEGTVAPNFGQPGGGYQFYIPDPTVLIKK